MHTNSRALCYLLRDFFLRPAAAAATPWSPPVLLPPLPPPARRVPPGPRVSCTTCLHSCWKVGLWLTASTWVQLLPRALALVVPLPMARLRESNRRATCRARVLEARRVHVCQAQDGSCMLTDPLLSQPGDCRVSR